MIIFVVENLFLIKILKVILYPNAKINLGLNIIKKRFDGYHEINSVFYPVNSLFDILEVVPSDIFAFSSSGVTIPNGTNICIKAFRLLQSDFSISNVKIHLHKKIAIGAGLGGGSSDGAFTLIALNKIFKLKLTNDQLKKYALILGADCPFFIDNTPKFISGIGEVMTNLNINLSKYKLKFFFPEIHISSEAAYSELVLQQIDTKLLELVKQPIEKWKQQLRNDFEFSAFNNFPILKKVKQKFYEEGALYSSMTGSGSVIYAIFNK